MDDEAMDGYFENGIRNYFASENVNQTKRIRNIIHELLDTQQDYALIPSIKKILKIIFCIFFPESAEALWINNIK